MNHVYILFYRAKYTLGVPEENFLLTSYCSPCLLQRTSTINYDCSEYIKTIKYTGPSGTN